MHGYANPARFLKLARPATGWFLGLGVVLMAVEVFLLPGFGVPGILGFVLMGAGFLFLAGGVTLGDTDGLTRDLVVDFGLQFVLVALSGFGLLALFSRWFPSTGLGRHLRLAAPGGATVPLPPPAPPSPLAGRRGLAVSDLRPGGTAEIDGRLVDVVTEGGWVPAGSAVLVVGVDGAQAVVRPLGSEGR